jgi:GTP pyrophosphokinase
MISLKIEDSREQQEKYISRFISPINRKLSEEKIKFEIKSRAKSIPSINSKMEIQGVPFEQVYDLFAIRVILTDVLTEKEYEFIDEFKKRVETEGDLRQDKKARKFLGKDSVEVSDSKKAKELPEKQFDPTTEEALKAELKKKFETENSRYNELLLKEKTACWQAYSLITNIYQPNPKRFRDWITTPKVSGYESLHTTVLGPDERWVEVQIRTARMDEVAEKGDAAHWRYKESAYGRNVDQWMFDVRNVLETIGAQRLEDGKTSRITVKSDNIYVLTPDGDLRELKAGSTVLDFAFDIHSEIGSKCIGAKIGGKVCPIRHQLSNGDRVEIITSKNQKPNIDWLNFVVTTKAKSRINRALREDKYKDAEAGKEILMRKLKNWKIDFSDHNIARIVKYYSFQKPVDLFYNVAIGKLDVLEVKQLFTTTDEIDEKTDVESREVELTEEFIENQSMKDHGYILIEAGVSNLNYSLAKCCNPVAGERVFGFVTVLHGIKIHRYDCPNAPDMREKYPYRVIKAQWKQTKNTQFFVTNLRVLGQDRVGLLNDITKVISDDLKTNMLNLNFKTLGTNFEGVIKVQVRDVDHLGFLKKKLQNIKGILRVIRFD